jgi:hypothetical protein
MSLKKLSFGVRRVRNLCYGRRLEPQSTGRPMSEQSTTAFFDVWHTYRKVVAVNYMYHMEIKAHIEQMLHAQFVGRPFSFLDLGCGDAAILAPLLESYARQAGRSMGSSPKTCSISVRTCLMPCATTIPNSARCARNAFASIVCCRIRSARVRCSMRTAC